MERVDLYSEESYYDGSVKYFLCHKKYNFRSFAKNVKIEFLKMEFHGHGLIFSFWAAFLRISTRSSGS